MSLWQCPDCGTKQPNKLRCTSCGYRNSHRGDRIDLERQVTLLLREADTRKVRAVIRTDSALSDALFDIAAGQQRNWDLESWAVLVKELERCNTKVETWIEEHDNVT